MRLRKSRLAILAAVAVAAVACHGNAAEPLNIRAGWANTPAALTPIIFARKDILKHYGQSYTLEAMKFAGTSPEITALATGDLDIATLAFSSLGAAIENAKMDDIRVIGDGFQDGVAGYFTSQYLVLKDSPITSIEDLKGKVLVSNAIGGAIDMGIRNMLRQHKLEDKKDLSIIEASFPAMVPMLNEHKADLIGSVPPFTQMARAEGDTRVLFTLKDASGTTEMIFSTARKGWIETNRAALVDFTEDWIRALRWYLDPANHDEAVRIVADYTKLKPQAFQSWLFTKDDYYRDPSARPNVAALQANLDTQRELGFQKTRIEARRYVDMSLIDEALQRIE